MGAPLYFTASDLFAPEALGFVRVAVVSPELRVADVDFNVGATVEALEGAAAQGCRLAVFPELGLTGYSCADLFYQSALLEAARAALDDVAMASARVGCAAVVGLPLAVDGRLYNCAALVAKGEVLGIVPKTYLPNTNEFYEERWFTSGRLASTPTVDIGMWHQTVPFGVDLLFQAANFPGLTLGIEICEDLWAVQPPSGAMAVAGATLLANLSASNELLAKVEYRRELVRQQSARCLAAYLYAGAGANESSTDTVWAGHSLIAENGLLLAETERFRFDTQMAVADVDVQRLLHERLRNSSFSAAQAGRTFRTVPFHLPGDTPTHPWEERRALLDSLALRRPLSRYPFVPADPTRRAASCREIFSIQATGLARRLRHVGAQRVTIGVSGGLDSTLALLVAAKAFDILGLPREGIVAITMPGFGTTERTRNNAVALAEALGVTLRTIPIVDAVRQHFRDIGHDEAVHDVTYENAQARERTQILMDVANQVGGLVVGTGDLSELALGWLTYSGDHMSMYHVNAGVPKTLVRYLIEWVAEAEFSGQASAVLRDIIATPITPELLPLDKRGQLQQRTEDAIGPYELHDFFLYYVVRYQFPPRKVFVLARQAFAGAYDDATILRWLEVFYRRFFSQQFKRSAMPDGPKVGSVALSPRGDWRMPSDATAAVWLEEIKRMREE
ncbi:MAG: NAD(+) synthase [Caldilineales bacterium]|nr:NAD(+) synthase [Caldilineales bacterium]MDW8318938.1 NAD(+) synthase [Anaerolineae bacterium]